MRGLVRRGISAGLGAAMLAGLVGTVPASADPVPLPTELLGNALWGAAARLYDPGAGYHKHVVITAELLDWRARNPAAPEATVAAHVAAVEQSVNTKFSEADSRRSTAEVLGRLLEIVYATPGAEITGTQVGSLLGALATRDITMAGRNIEERISGAQQRFNVTTPYFKAQSAEWVALRERSASDTPLKKVWQNSVGKPTQQNPEGLDPTWTLDKLKDLAKLKELLDVPRLIEKAGLGLDPLLNEVKLQFAKLEQKLNGTKSELAGLIDDVLETAGAPGAPNGGPTAEEIKAAQKAEAERQEKIDNIKAGFDVLVKVVDFVDPGIAKHLAAFGETVYKVATAVNQIYTGILTLAASTGIGASTFGVIGGIVGAVVGLIQIFAGIFGGEENPTQAEQQLMDAMKSGFNQLKQYLDQIYSTMNERFDRIDTALNTIYQDMMEQFGYVIDLLNGIQHDVRTLQGELLELASRIQDFNLQILRSEETDIKQNFMGMADKYIDYQFVNNTPIPAYDTTASNYVEGASAFKTIATWTSAQAPFIWASSSGTPTDALALAGPAGAVNYLATYARNHYDPNFPVPSRAIPNGDLWAAAARAYTLVALQNPTYAAQESSARADAITTAGRDFRDAAATFSAPRVYGPFMPINPTWTNELFRNLMDEHTRNAVRFANKLKDFEDDPPVMIVQRVFDLWGGINQSVDPEKLPSIPATVARCGGSATINTPGFITGKNLPKPVLFGRYLEGTNWKYSNCWTNAAMTAPTNHMVTRHAKQIKVNGEWETVWEVFMAKGTTVSAQFREYIQPPGVAAPILVRTANGAGPVTLCTWSGIVDDPDATPPAPSSCSPSLDPNSHIGNAPLGQTSAALVEDSGDAAATKLYKQRQAAYYNLVYTALHTNGLPEARALNNTTVLLRAYTELGFPVARENDDQLTALLYGARSLPADLADSPILSATMAKAISNLHNGKSMLDDQKLIDTVAPVIVLPGACQNKTTVEVDGDTLTVTTRDPLARCIVARSKERQLRIADRYELHFKDRQSAGAGAQTNPMTAEALRTLSLTSRRMQAL